MENDLTNIILVGAGGHAKSCIDVINQHAVFQVAGLIDNGKKIGSRFMGITIIGNDDDLEDVRFQYSSALVSVGQIKSCEIRRNLFEKLVALKFAMPLIVSRTATVSGYSHLEPGTIVMPGSIIGPNVQIGMNCIVNSGALVEHDCEIGAHCHIATRAVLNGNVHVGKGSFVGSGAIVRQGVKIGSDCVISMGARVFHDVPDGTTLRGH